MTSRYFIKESLKVAFIDSAWESGSALNGFGFGFGQRIKRAEKKVQSSGRIFSMVLLCLLLKFLLQQPFQTLRHFLSLPEGFGSEIFITRKEEWVIIQGTRVRFSFKKITESVLDNQHSTLPLLSYGKMAGKRGRKKREKMVNFKRKI